MTRTIINKRKHSLKTENGVLLRPGKNDLGAAKVEALRKSEAARTWHELSWISVQKPPPESLGADLGGDEESDSPLRSLNAKEAIAMVASVEDAEMLLGILDDEKRSTVRSAIERRLDELTAASGEGGGQGDESDSGAGASEGGEGSAPGDG